MNVWVRVVIVNFNSGDYLQAVVDGLARQSDGDFEAVIVDNHSNDGSIERLTIPDGRFRVHLAGASLGFAAGSNLGARGAQTSWIAMLNPDAIPQQNWLEALRQATAQYPEIVMFGSTQLILDDPDRLDGAGDGLSIFGIAWRGGYGSQSGQLNGDALAFSPCAAGALYRRDIFEAQHGFAENFFCYLEDVDLGFRIRLAGYEAMQVGAARILHAGSVTTGSNSPLTLRHTARNSVRLLFRCMPLMLLVLAVPLFLLTQLYLARHRMERVPRIMGLIDGLRAIPSLLSERRQIQRNRHIRLAAITSQLVWNPKHITRRSIVQAKPIRRRAL